MKRVISIWLPRWPVDRLNRDRRRRGAPDERQPLALVVPGRHGLRLSAVNPRAAAAGIEPGTRLADARALLPGLVTHPADAGADRRALERLALWCVRFTPWCAPDGDDGLLLDIAGCAHLHGGEEEMTNAIASRLAAFGIEARTGLADTPGAAWALARFADGKNRIAAPGDARAALATLPVEGLRIAPDTAAALRRLGLTTVGAVARIPRAALARRFSPASGAILQRLDQAFGTRTEPFSPLVPAPALAEILKPVEPLLEPAGLRAAAERLVAALANRLKTGRQGARALSLWFFRVDGTVARCDVATSRATRRGDHFLRLFAERLGAVDPGFGVEAAALHATRVESLQDAQPSLLGRDHGTGDFERLVDRLLTRLGNGAVFRLEPFESHVPEKAQRGAAEGRTPWPACPVARPFRLLAPPERVSAGVETSDGPPVSFTWRRRHRRVARAAGPERIAPEWWLADGDGCFRDYYRVEDTEGRGYWLYRTGTCEAGASPRWFLHGFYG